MYFSKFLRFRSVRSLVLPFVMAAALAAGCTGQEPAALQIPNDTEVSELKGGTDEMIPRTQVSFTLFQDDIGAAGQIESRRVFTSNEAYRSYFGHDAPSDVNFATEWVFFYSAGERPSGGFASELRSITRVGSDVSILTSLLSPGPSCLTTAAITKPYVLARFPGQAGALSVHYFRADRVKDCAASACAAVLCMTGQRCVLEQVQCVREPCDPQPRCVDITEVTCGGFAGKACPGAGICADDPRDSCDESKGGRDCSGLCECPATGLCRTGHWDSSPAVCSCVP